MMEHTIIRAMRDRRALEFTYEGHWRVVSPHALYRESRRRRPTLHAWQTDGQSETRVIPCWGNFTLAKIVNLSVLDQAEITPQPGFNPKRYKEIIYSIL